MHELKLKPGCVVMCVRNLLKDVCNGTKLRVNVLHRHLIDCTILTGPGKGRTVAIPRIVLVDTSNEEQFILRRKQFPLSLAYSMTIDKSQGQSLSKVGIVLDTQCFAHGQLYTALSRCRDPTQCTVLSPLESLRNVVWNEVFPAS